jgi:CheY-like chemotaxis protein
VFLGLGVSDCAALRGDDVPSRVLIIDDSPVMCELIREVLLSADIDCFTLTESSKAADHLKSEKFGAIFLDVRMPFPDGIELTRTVRTGGLNRTTPIVIITGDEDRGLLSRAFEAGASFFLFKPVDRHRILRLIRVTESSIESEARRFQRVKISCRVSLQWGQSTVDGVTLDLSTGGMLVHVSTLIPVGTRVHVTLEAKPGEPPLALEGRIARAVGNDSVGLQIENEGSKERRRLQEFLLPMILAKVD